MKISVVGLGYVGLPLALQASVKGHLVIGVDKNPIIIDKINARSSHIDETFITELLKKTSIKAQDFVESSDAYIICVPTPVDEHNRPDLKPVIDASISIARVLEDKQLVILESTVNPGICEELIKPILDKTGKRYLLAHCPERINPGDKKWNVSNIPRVVGGLTAEASNSAKLLYESIIDATVTSLSNIKAAEATKIMENTFRDINIAFVNEMAQSFYRMDIDIMEVIKGASTKPFAFMPHYPGVGVGGHCIAVDPYYMIEKGKESGFDHDFLILARRINSGMPRYTVKMIQNELNLLGYCINGTKIAVLGLAYKPNVADERESPSYPLINILKNKKAVLQIFDPHLPSKSNVSSLKEAVKDAVCIVIATAHNEFLTDINIFKDSKLVIDGRNCLDKKKIRELGVVYKGIGVR